MASVVSEILDQLNLAGACIGLFARDARFVLLSSDVALLASAARSAVAAAREAREAR